MPIKPSENEEEYFSRMDQERLKQLSAERKKKMAAEELEKRRELHYMHCPKCGDKLNEIGYLHIKIDKCPSCDGIWLDAGELETILQDKDQTLMKKVLKIFSK